MQNLYFHKYRKRMKLEMLMYWLTNNYNCKILTMSLQISFAIDLQNYAIFGSHCNWKFVINGKLNTVNIVFL